MDEKSDSQNFNFTSPQSSFWFVHAHLNDDGWGPNECLSLSSDMISNKDATPVPNELLVCSNAELQFFLNWLLPPLACTYIYTYIHIHKQYINDCHWTIPSADTCVASCKWMWNRRFEIKFCVKIWAYSRLTVYFRINREVRRYDKIYSECTQQLLTCRCRRLWNCVSSRTLILCLQKPVTLDVDVEQS